MKTKLALASLIAASASCVGLTSGLTGQPIVSESVQRSSGTGKAFQVASSDILRAESQPDQVWGLYNAGVVAAQTGEVISSGK